MTSMYPVLHPSLSSIRLILFPFINSVDPAVYLPQSYYGRSSGNSIIQNCESISETVTQWLKSHSSLFQRDKNGSTLNTLFYNTPCFNFPLLIRVTDKNTQYINFVPFKYLPRFPAMKFTMEVEANDTRLFLGVLVMKKCLHLVRKVHRKPTQVQSPTSCVKGSHSYIYQSSQGHMPGSEGFQQGS